MFLFQVQVYKSQELEHKYNLDKQIQLFKWPVEPYLLPIGLNITFLSLLIQEGGDSPPPPYFKTWIGIVSFYMPVNLLTCLYQ